MNHRLIIIIIVSVIAQLLTGCSLSISHFSENINKAVKANNDPQTVMQALPTYLILMDGLIENDPEDEDMLIASARLMNAYAGLLGAELDMMSAQLEDDQNKYQREQIKNQKKKLTLKSLQRAEKANCISEEYLCNLTSLKYSEFEKQLQNIDEDDINMIYSLGTVWAAWLQANRGDWNAMAKLPHIKLIMQRVISIDEKWDNAGAHMYLGVLNSLLPSALGGKPEDGKENFETAIKITQGKNLMVKVLYAEYYARLTFNKALHQKLVSDVLSTTESPDKFLLINALAIQKAKALQASAKDYF